MMWLGVIKSWVSYSTLGCRRSKMIGQIKEKVFIIIIIVIIITIIIIIIII